MGTTIGRKTGMSFFQIGPMDQSQFANYVNGPTFPGFFGDVAGRIFFHNSHMKQYLWIEAVLLQNSHQS